MMEDLTDISKAVATDRTKEWFIVPTYHADPWFSYVGRNSIIVHKCPEWTPELRSPMGAPYDSLGYWHSIHVMETACTLCDVPPPEDIVQQWLLHNFDTLSQDWEEQCLT